MSLLDREFQEQQSLDMVATLTVHTLDKIISDGLATDHFKYMLLHRYGIRCYLITVD